jgi:dihydrofolate reductase
VTPTVVYSMGVSLDGYIVDADGRFDWAAPDEEVHRFANEEARGTGAQLYGRRLYEVMRAWETIDEHSDVSEPEIEFAALWKQTPKYVFSNTLERVGDEYTLVRGDIAEAVKRLKEQHDGDLAVGGAGLAASFMRLGLIDEYRLLVNPVIVGGGTPFFPEGLDRIDLRLVETRTFASGVVHLRYER